MQYVLKLMGLLPLIPKYWHDRRVPWQLAQMLTCFLRLHAITVSTHAIFCVPIYALTVTWITSTLWLLWIILLWTNPCLSICFHLFCVYIQKGDFWPHRKPLFNFLSNCRAISHSSSSFYISTFSVQGPNFSISSPALKIFHGSFWNGCELASHSGIIT